MARGSPETPGLHPDPSLSCVPRETTEPASSTIDKTTLPTPGVSHIDSIHGDLRIIARHLMVTNMRGTFRHHRRGDEPTPESRVEIEARTGSVTTDPNGNTTAGFAWHVLPFDRALPFLWTLYLFMRGDTWD